MVHAEQQLQVLFSPEAMMFGKDRHQMIGAEVEDSLAASTFDSEGAGTGNKAGKFIPAETAITLRI
ncbi:MAG: hypothetical protein H2172_12390 [Opitutus sp.]|nr:hypothetical protein [Opitutus sp.]